MSVLDSINQPADLRGLSLEQLQTLAAELREEMVGRISRNGGHLASSLGAVELSIALHRVFDSPADKIVWDVGHQSYAHKLLTGRRDRFATIRQHGGLSGFTDPAESAHDAFIGGHASNSISAALGMALARDLVEEPVPRCGRHRGRRPDRRHGHRGPQPLAGHVGTRMIVILNDNGMAISPSVGGLLQDPEPHAARPEVRSGQEEGLGHLHPACPSEPA